MAEEFTDEARARFYNVAGEFIQDTHTIETTRANAPRRLARETAPHGPHRETIDLMPTEGAIIVTIAEDDRDEALAVVLSALNAWQDGKTIPRTETVVEGVTLRNFDLVAFNDSYGRACTLQESSSAMLRAVWLGQDGSGRMHLSAAHLAMLLPYIHRVIAGEPLLARPSPTSEL